MTVWIQNQEIHLPSIHIQAHARTPRTFQEKNKSILFFTSLPHKLFFISTHLSIYLFLSAFLSVSQAPMQSLGWLLCKWVRLERGREGKEGVRHSARGVLLFLFSLSCSIVPRITAISTQEEYFNIRYSSTHSVKPSSQDFPSYTVQSSILPCVNPSIHPFPSLTAEDMETNVQRNI